MVEEVPEGPCGAMQEAMPYEELNKLVNEDLLNQYIESRCSSRPCSFIPSVSGATFHLCGHMSATLLGLPSCSTQVAVCVLCFVYLCSEGCGERVSAEACVSEARHDVMHCRRAVLAEIELSSVGMNDIFEREGLKVTDEELRAEVDSVTQEFGQNGQTFDKERLEEQAMEVLKVGQSALQHRECLVDASGEQRR